MTFHETQKRGREESEGALGGGNKEKDNTGSLTIPRGGGKLRKPFLPWTGCQERKEEGEIDTKKSQRTVRSGHATLLLIKNFDAPKGKEESRTSRLARGNS